MGCWKLDFDMAKRRLESTSEDLGSDPRNMWRASAVLVHMRECGRQRLESPAKFSGQLVRSVNKREPASNEWRVGTNT